MKVVQINAVYQTGSTGRITMELHHAMEAAGIESHVFSSDGISPEAHVSMIGNKLDHKVHALFSRVTGLQGYYSGLATKRLLSELDRVSPDIVHLHNLHANYIHLPMLLKYLSRRDIATVVTLHDCWFFTGKCTHYTTQGCAFWQSGCHDCPKLKTDNVSWFFDRTSKMWNDKKELFAAIPRLGVIGVSDWITNEGKKSILQNAKMIKRIYNWIDLDVFQPKDSTEIRKRYGWENKFLILGVASGWSEKKGLNDFIKLAEHLQNDEQIVLVGGMPQINLPETITVIPATSDVNELVELYSAADVFLQLSQEETFGKVVAEALACGTPVITNVSTANPELVASGCGLIVHRNTSDSLTNAIQQIKNNGKKRYSSNCRGFAAKEFNKIQLINETLEMYKDLWGY